MATAPVPTSQELTSLALHTDDRILGVSTSPVNTPLPPQAFFTPAEYAVFVMVREITAYACQHYGDSPGPYNYSGVVNDIAGVGGYSKVNFDVDLSVLYFSNANGKLNKITGSLASKVPAAPIPALLQAGDIYTLTYGDPSWRFTASVVLNSLY